MWHSSAKSASSRGLLLLAVEMPLILAYAWLRVHVRYGLDGVESENLMPRPAGGDVNPARRGGLVRRPVAVDVATIATALRLNT